MRAVYLLVDPGCPAVKIYEAKSFFSRLRGLLFSRSLPVDEGLLLRNCSGVHMLGMLYAIDVIYLDENGGILKLVERLRPFQCSCCRKAVDVMELPCGFIAQRGWRIGRKVELYKK